MGKVHVGDLLCDGHKLWYRIGCGPGMPGPYGVVESGVGGIGWAILTKLYRILTGFPLI